MNLQEQILRIKLIIETINKSSSSLFDQYLATKPELIELYQEIENKLGDKFTKENFDEEIKYSLGLKNYNGKFDDEAVQKFNEMVKKHNLTDSVRIKNNSLRDYKKQKDTFINKALDHGRTIKGGLRQAALPGFSQHHTGKAFDITNPEKLSDEILQEFGFVRPYPTDTGFRMAEPWHILYKG